MRVYFDTSVLVAATVKSHSSNLQAAAVLRSARAKEIQGFISTHGLAETYAVLTRLPLRPAIYPAEAWQIITRSLLPCFEIVELNSDDYQLVLQRCAERGWIGGRVYDLLHASAAQKAECERIYTFNLKHFQELNGAWAGRVRTP